MTYYNIIFRYMVKHKSHLRFWVTTCFLAFLEIWIKTITPRIHRALKTGTEALWIYQELKNEEGHGSIFYKTLFDDLCFKGMMPVIHMSKLFGLQLFF